MGAAPRSSNRWPSVLTALFWTAAVVHILAILLSLPLAALISKPMLMVFLGLYFIIHCPGLKSSHCLPPLAAVFFSWLGDVFLMFQHLSERWFLAGLGAFLIAQIMYVIAYTRYRDPVSVLTRPVIRVVLYTLLVLYAMLLWSKLYPVLNGFLLPVTLYTLAILTMTLMAAARIGRTSPMSFVLVLAGSVLFLISDSMIAINKFLQPLPAERILVMSTYFTGQFLIIRGLVIHLKAPLQQGLQDGIAGKNI